MKIPLKRFAKWVFKVLKREAKSELLKKVVPMQEIPRIKKRG